MCNGSEELESQVVTSTRHARICPSDQRECGSARALFLVGCGPCALEKCGTNQGRLQVAHVIDQVS